MVERYRRVEAFAMPSEYERAAMEARRRQRMAEMLAQQEFNPASFPNAPIPTAYPLVRALKGFLSGREEALAEKALERAQEADVAGERELREKLGPRSQIAAPTNTQIAESVGMPQIAEDGTVSYGQTAMPKLGMEQVMPTAQERERAIEEALFSGTPRAQKYAQFLMAKEPQSQLMEFGDQLLNVTGSTATPVTMGGKPIQAMPRAATGSNISKLIAEREALPPGSPLRSVYDNAIAKETSTAPAVSVSVGEKTPNKYTEALAEGVAKQDLEAIALGESAIPQIESSFRVRDLLKQNPITGTGANARLGLERALATAGFGKGERATITENLSAELAKTTLGAIRSSGLGSGQGFTDKDRQFLERAAAGQIELTQANLLYLAELNDRAGRAAIARSNAVRARARQLPQFRGLPNMFPDIVAPPAYGSQLPPGAVLDPSPR